MGHYDLQGAVVENAMGAIADHISGTEVKIVWGKSDSKRVCADLKGKKLFIPRAACGNNITPEALATLRGLCAHEASHIDLSTGDKSKGMLGEFENCLEDVRIESIEAGKHAGASSIFYTLNSQTAKEIAINQGKAESDGKEGMGPLRDALVRLILQMGGVHAGWSQSKESAEYQAKALKYFQKAPSCKNTDEIRVLAKQMLEDLKAQDEKPEDQDSGDGEPSEESGEQGDKSSKESKKGDKVSSKEKGSKGKDKDENGSGDDSSESEGDDDQEGKGNGETEEEGSEEGEGSGKGSGNGESEGDESNGSGESDSNSSADQNSDDESDSEEGSGVGASHGKAQDIMKKLEKDLAGDDIETVMNNKLQYDLDKCHSTYTSYRDGDEFKSPTINAEMQADYKTRREKANSIVTGLTSAFTTCMRAMAMAHKQSHQRRGKLDMRDIYKVANDSDCENVFFKMKQGEKINTAVSILIDESGSMSSIMDKVVDVAMIVTEALDNIKIPFCMMGHSTKECDKGDPSVFDRHNPLIMPVYKQFHESWGVVKARLMDAQGRANNCDCEALRYSCEALRGRKETRKIVFVLSDGEPASGNGYHKEEMFAQALKDNVDKYRKEGVEIYNISLDTHAPERYYGVNNCIFLDTDRENFGFGFAKVFCDVIMKVRFQR